MAAALHLLQELMTCKRLQDPLGMHLESWALQHVLSPISSVRFENIGTIAGMLCCRNMLLLCRGKKPIDWLLSRVSELAASLSSKKNIFPCTQHRQGQVRVYLGHAYAHTHGAV